MNLIELIIDRKRQIKRCRCYFSSVTPAIESNFVALKSEEIKLTEVSK